MTERKFCSKGVDSVWYHSMMKAQRMREREEEYRRDRDTQLATKVWMPSLSYLLKFELSLATVVMRQKDLMKFLMHAAIIRAEPTSSEAKTACGEGTCTTDPLPCEYQHIRSSS